MKNNNTLYVKLVTGSLKSTLRDLYPELSDSDIDAYAEKVVVDNEGLLPNSYSHVVGTTIKVLPYTSKVVVDETPVQG